MINKSCKEIKQNVCINRISSQVNFLFRQKRLVMTVLSEDMQRLEEILTRKGIKKSVFMEKMGIESQHYNNWRHRGIPGKKILIISKYVQEHAEWINSGDNYYQPSWMPKIAEKKSYYDNDMDITDEGRQLIQLITSGINSEKLKNDTVTLIKQLVYKLMENQ